MDCGAMSFQNLSRIQKISNWLQPTLGLLYHAGYRIFNHIGENEKQKERKMHLTEH